MKGFSWKHIALKVDVIGPQKKQFAGAFEHLSARTFTCWDSKGVNHHRHGHHCHHYQRLLDHQRCFSPASSVDGSDDDGGDHQRNKDVHDGALLVVVVVRMLLFH